MSVIQAGRWPCFAISIGQSNRFLFWGDDQGVVNKLHIDSNSLQQFQVHNDRIRIVLLSDDGDTVITHSDDRTFVVLDAETFAVKRRYVGSKVASSLAMIGTEVIMTACESAAIVNRLWISTLES